MAVFLRVNSALAQNSTIPPGTYTAVASDMVITALAQPGEYRITLKEDGKFVYGYNVRTLSTGIYAVNGDNLEFTMTWGIGDCAGKSVFKWSLQGNRLSLAPAPGQTYSCQLIPWLSGAYFKTDQVDKLWKNIGPTGGNIRSLLVKDTKIFAGTYGGGIFSSADQGQSWNVKGTYRGGTITALAAFNGNLYAGTENNIILISLDEGETWQFQQWSTGGAPPNFTLSDFAEFNGKLYAATRGQGVIRLTDNPIVWENSGTTGLTDLNATSLVVAGGMLYVGTDGGGVFVSTDGNIWAPASNGITFPRISTLAVSGNTIYAGTSAGTPATNEVYYTQNNGQNWTRVGNGLAASFQAGYQNQVYDLLPFGGKLFAASSNGVIVNEGANWRAVYQGTFIPYFYSLAVSGNQIFAGSGGFGNDGISRSSDGGTTWSQVNNGLYARNVSAVLKDNGVLYVGVNDGAFISTNDGQTWTRTNIPGPTVANFLAFDGKVLAGTTFGVYSSSNQGQSWTRTSNGLASGQVNRIVPLGNTLFASVYNAGVYRSTDSGANWTSANNGLASPKVWDLVAMNGNLFVSTLDSGVLRSTDQGQSWSAAPNSGLPSGQIQAMAVSGNILFAAVMEQGIYYSIDNGGAWVKSTGGFSNPYVARLHVSGGNIYAAGGFGIGVMRSTDNGQNWGLYNAGFDSGYGLALFVSGSTLYAGGLNGLYASTCLVNPEVTVSAADYSVGSIVEKSIVAAYGVQLATGIEIATSQPLPTSLAGTTVKVRDSNGVERLAPLFYVSPDQINYEVPAGTATGPATVMILNGDGFAAIGSMHVKLSAPTIFTNNYSGSGPAAALDAFTYAPGPFNATQSNGQPNILAVFGTGLGGDATEVSGDVSGSVTTRLNGNVIVTAYAGNAPGYVGLNQYNIILPEGIGTGTYSLTFARGGVTSNTVTISIR
ncbi:MAG: hypothetical protein AB7H86_00575 [Blastocatellales bacterium]